MANEQHLNLLKQGSVVWNKWREENPATKACFASLDLTNADLSRADLSGANLQGVDLSRANLLSANLSGAHLYRANLCYVELARADLSEANLGHADLRGAHLEQANLSGVSLGYADLRKAELGWADLTEARLTNTNFRGANLYNANLTKADLLEADLRGTNLTEANLSEARVTSVLWDRSRMRGRYLGIRGVDSCYGNALFKRAAADQDFLDTLEANWHNDWRSHLFHIWGWLDYGRSMWRVAVFGFAATSLFAAVFYMWPALLDYRQSANTWFTPYYYSVVTFTTLGFGDVRPAGAVGEILAAFEVVVGYVTLGLLLAVLAEKLARRA
jgi:uncharacterized protein YjbI with pentapeptide repeats